MNSKKLSIGDSIMITSDTIYSDIEIGDTGIIESFNIAWSRSFRVKIHKKINNRSGSGLYYFSDNEFEKCNVFDDIPTLYPKTVITAGDINYKKLINARFGTGVINMKNKQLLKGYKKVAVRFATSDGYNDIWYAMYDDVAAIDDKVLCMTGHHGEAIGTIKAIEAFENDNIVVEYGREIICKIDYSTYYDRQKKLKRISKLKETMSKKKAELDELAVYELLAKSSPEMADMLKELKELL